MSDHQYVFYNLRANVSNTQIVKRMVMEEVGHRQIGHIHHGGRNTIDNLRRDQRYGVIWNLEKCL